jgi:DNA-binding response OmpR family regulator
MIRLLIITQESKKLAWLCESLHDGLVCSITSYDNGVREAVTSQKPDIVLLEMGGNLPDAETSEFLRRQKQERSLPVMALVPEEMLDSVDGRLDADDFLVSPYDPRELALRARRLLHRAGQTSNSEQIQCNGLVIDLATCEVTIEARVVELTFKEYELLKLLASNRGRVYTREALLNRVWGYDYYGGDRTVDVHVRRLRSKIEDSSHTFIETVRNIGYRFIKEA